MLHIFIALLSIIVTTIAYAAPSRGLLRSSYGLAGLTLASGLSLIVSQPAHMLQACMAGVVYLCVVSLGIIMARRKLAIINAAQASK